MFTGTDTYPHVVVALKLLDGLQALVGEQGAAARRNHRGPRDVLVQAVWPTAISDEVFGSRVGVDHPIDLRPSGGQPRPVGKAGAGYPRTDLHQAGPVGRHLDLGMGRAVLDAQRV